MSYEYIAAGNSQLHQKFSGYIEQQSFISPETNNQATMEILRADLMLPEDSLFIPDQEPNLALSPWADEYPVAILEFGSANEENRQTGPFETLILKVSPRLIAGLQYYGAAKHGALVKELSGAVYLLATRRKGFEGVEGYGVIDRTTGFGIIGRRTNIDWFEKDGGPAKLRPDNTNLTPYEDNKTISRLQLVLSHLQGGLMISQRSEKCPSRVITRAMPVHEDLVEAGKSSIDPTQPSRKWLGALARHTNK